MMNQIESEFAGRVVSILVENGSPVEFGQAALRHRRMIVRRTVRERAPNNDARQSPDRQPRRDRTSHLSRLPRARHQDRRRPLDGRHDAEARAARRRDRLHRPAALAAELSQHAGDHRRGRGHGRRRDPSGLRLPVGERRLRRARRGERLHLHRAEARDDSPDGRQGVGDQDDARSRRAVRAGVRRAARRTTPR